MDGAEASHRICQKTQFNISHVEKKKERRSVGQLGGVKTGCLALHRCLFNNSWRLLKWPQTHTYKHLIVSTMIVYNGSLELYINNKAMFFFLKPFPVGWVLGFQRNRVRLLHLKVARLYAAPLLWIAWRKNFIRWYTGSDRTQAEQCVTPLKPTTTKKNPSAAPRVFIFIQGLAAGVENSCWLSEMFEDE